MTANQGHEKALGELIDHTLSDIKRGIFSDAPEFVPKLFPNIAERIEQEIARIPDHYPYAPWVSGDGVSEIDEQLTEGEKAAMCAERDAAWEALADNRDERVYPVVPDYCDCGQHVDEHDDELHDMRLDRPPPDPVALVLTLSECQHIGRLLMCCRAHAGNLTLTRSAWFNVGMVALEDADRDAANLAHDLDVLIDTLATI